MAIEAGSSTYYQAKRGIVQDGLVLHLDAGVKESYSGGTVWRDLSGNEYNGSIYNGANQTKVRGGSFSFDGVNDYIHIPSPSDRFAWTPSGNGLNTMSIELWVKSGDTGGHFLSKAWNGMGYYNIRISHSYFRLLATQSSEVMFSSIATNNWENIVCIATPTQVAVYKHGSVAVNFTNHNITGNTPGGPGNLNLALSIMTLYPYGSYGWSKTTHAINGNLSICRIYNKVLSANEILQNYNATRHRFGI